MITSYRKVTIMENNERKVKCTVVEMNLGESLLEMSKHLYVLLGDNPTERNKLFKTLAESSTRPMPDLFTTLFNPKKTFELDCVCLETVISHTWRLLADMSPREKEIAEARLMEVLALLFMCIQGAKTGETKILSREETQTWMKEYKERDRGEGDDSDIFTVGDVQ